MKDRIRKLYPAFALVAIPWFLLVVLDVRQPAVISAYGFNLVYLFLGLPPFLGHGVPAVGPWWFIPFIIQLYALWPLLRWMTKRFDWQGLLVVSALCLIACHFADPVLARYSTNLFFTPIGRIPVICFGIFAARYGVSVPAPLAAAGLVVLLLGSKYGTLWPLTFLAALLIVLWAYLQVRDVLRMFPVLVRMGEYSLYIFLVNVIVRDQFVPLAASPAQQLVLGGVSTAVSVLIGACMYEFLLPGPALRAQRESAFHPGTSPEQKPLPEGESGAPGPGARAGQAAYALLARLRALSLFLRLPPGE
jgi:hypothetical protein